MHLLVGVCNAINEWFLKFLCLPLSFYTLGQNEFMFPHFPNYYIFSLGRKVLIYLNLDLKWHKISKNFQVYITRYVPDFDTAWFSFFLLPPQSVSQPAIRFLLFGSSLMPSTFPSCENNNDSHFL